MTTWIGITDDGVVIAREAEGTLLVDRPGQRRYRDPAVHNGQTPEGFNPMPPLPADLADHTGWYAGGGRRILLTQVAEAYFGEPMILVEENGAVTRAYPLDGRTLVTDDGERLHLTDATIEAGAPMTRAYHEEPVTFTAGQAQLSGTVIRPAGTGPLRAAVVSHGAAGGQRDFCRLQAGPLLDAGVAVLIYDKPGHGRSGGAEPSIFDQATAIEAAFDHLRAHPDIDRQRVGLAGFSNSMWAVPMVAARRPEVAFICGLGAPGVSMAESEVHRRTKILREAGAGPTTLAAVAQAWRSLFTILADGPSTVVTARLGQALDTITAATDLAGYEEPDYVRHNPMLSPIPPRLPIDDLLAMIGDERDPQLSYDPTIDYARIHCPILLQYGADDTSVPVTASVTAIQSAVPDRGQLTVHIYPGLEHLLNQVPTLAGLTAEEAIYQFHEFRFGPAVWPDLAAWLATP
jgi:pimeloyl-ACP methyl ester carboxylesterase